jgi:hypothetical protein
MVSNCRLVKRRSLTPGRDRTREILLAYILAVGAFESESGDSDCYMGFDDEGWYCGGQGNVDLGEWLLCI